MRSIVHGRSFFSNRERVKRVRRGFGWRTSKNNVYDVTIGMLYGTYSRPKTNSKRDLTYYCYIYNIYKHALIKLANRLFFVARNSFISLFSLNVRITFHQYLVRYPM